MVWPRENHVVCKYNCNTQKYRALTQKNIKTWKIGMCNKLGRLTQVWNYKIRIHIILFIAQGQIQVEFKGVYCLSVFNIRTHKSEIHRVLLMEGRSLIRHTGNISTSTDYIMTINYTETLFWWKRQCGMY